MGAVDTTYTFTATDTITSAKMNNIIDQTTMTSDSCLSGGGLEVASGKLTISANAINSSRLAANSVTNTAISNGSVTPVKLSSGGPNWTGTGAGGVFSVPQTGLEFGTGHAQDYGCFIDLHSAATPTDFETRILRDGGANGDFKILNQGTGSITFGSSTNERMRITAAGNVGIGTTAPQVKLQVAGGAIRVEGHAGEGGQIELLNAANNDIQAVFDVDPDDTTRIWTLPFEPLSFGTNGGEKMRISANGNVGIGKTNPSTTLDVNGTVTATAFAGPLTGNASTATTVSNGAITAAKLDGAQSGSAPIFGVRAWANIDGTVGSVSVRQGGNVSGVVRNQLGRYTITFATPMQDTNYAIVAWARDANATDNNYFVSAASNATKLAGSFQIEVNSPGGTVDSPEVNVMVIR